MVNLKFVYQVQATVRKSGIPETAQDAIKPPSNLYRHFLPQIRKIRLYLLSGKIQRYRTVDRLNG
ncbi:hypothetical protein [Argonema antarcticum]|uniref:hypothetical protein n=1 Tax=Argonema antarcticum TaxID=2942763 RepID=UPI002012190E|nr:hypothetical protein [Argonema antarcticum]MCL1472154.1 hypothetical protein [Argonema antarcticum A004/B2]